jgi:hypothetical protein
VVCLSLGWCQEVREWCVPFILVGGVSLCLEVIHHIEKVSVRNVVPTLTSSKR